MSPATISFLASLGKDYGLFVMGVAVVAFVVWKKVIPSLEANHQLLLKTLQEQTEYFRNQNQKDQQSFLEELRSQQKDFTSALAKRDESFSSVASNMRDLTSAVQELRTDLRTQQLNQRSVGRGRGGNQ